MDVFINSSYEFDVHSDKDSIYISKIHLHGSYRVRSAYCILSAVGSQFIMTEFIDGSYEKYEVFPVTNDFIPEKVKNDGVFTKIGADTLAAFYDKPKKLIYLCVLRDEVISVVKVISIEKINKTNVFDEGLEPKVLK